MREGFQAWLKRLGTYWPEGYIEIPEREHAYALLTGHICQDGYLAMPRRTGENTVGFQETWGMPKVYTKSQTAAGGVGIDLTMFGATEYELHESDGRVYFYDQRIKVEGVWVYHNDTAARTIELFEVFDYGSASNNSRILRNTLSVTNAVCTRLWPPATIAEDMVLQCPGRTTTGNTQYLRVNGDAVADTKIITLYVKYRRIL